MHLCTTCVVARTTRTRHPNLYYIVLTSAPLVPAHEHASVLIAIRGYRRAPVECIQIYN